MKRRACLFGLASLATLGAASALRPHRRASEIYSPIALESQVPQRFAGWQIDRSMVPVLPDPSLQSKLDQIYSQTLARTYVNQNGQRVMLSIAYGADQGSDATQAHRPEFCYSAQGFTVQKIGQTWLRLGGSQLRAERLIGRMGPRFEPITYWMTMNDQAILPGMPRKLAQIRVGLNGLIPDGMLVRVSTVGMVQQESFDLQDRFLSELHATMPEAVRHRYFGA